MNNYHKKRFFVLLMVLALFSITALTLFFFLGIRNNSLTVRVLLSISLIIVFILTLLLGLAIFLLVERMYYGRNIGRFGPIIKRSIKFLYPIVMTISDLFGINKDKIRGSFIEINNELTVTNSKVRYKPEELLVLMPHCIQYHGCKNKITSDLSNCTKCGKCDITGIIDITSRYKVQLAIATGGTLARKIIKETRPKGVLAVACERDLSSGILDCDPLPVIGVLNLRPNGPCYNTGVDLDQLEDGLKKFIKEAN